MFKVVLGLIWIFLIAHTPAAIIITILSAIILNIFISRVIIAGVVQLIANVTGKGYAKMDAAKGLRDLRAI